MKKFYFWYLLILIIVALLPQMVEAQQNRTQQESSTHVTANEAQEVGLLFLNANTSNRLRSSSSLQMTTAYRTAQGDTAFYVFNTANGFVMVAADRCATPILGYSDEGQFDIHNIPIQMQEYLQGFVEQIAYGINNLTEEDETTSQRWQEVRSSGHLRNTRNNNHVDPLITANWGQGCYYNVMCPEFSDGDCGHAKVGCVATAMGMIMHYWGYPSHGTGSWNGVNFGETTYNWENMPNQLGQNSTQEEVNAVATLLWHCGIAVHMAYSGNSSAAFSYDVPYALSHYFNYSVGSWDDLEDWSQEEQLERIKNNLNTLCPLYFNSVSEIPQHTGHGWVCDGYDSSDLLHFNWGWSGLGNGYYVLNAHNVTGYEFNNNTHVIFNIIPRCEVDSAFTVIVTSNSVEGNVTGGGAYNCSDQCAVTASPNEGVQFDYWTENGRYISSDSCYIFGVTQNRELEAHFSEEKVRINAGCNPIIGGTVRGNSNTTLLSYDNGIVDCACGGEEMNSWGVMFPSEKLGGQQNLLLTKVIFWEWSRFYGEVLIYQGGSDNPDSLIYQQPFHSSGIGGFAEIPILPSLEIDTTKNLWIVLHNFTGFYVAAYSTNNDHPDNAHWVGYKNGNQEWGANVTWYGNWMIRGYLESAGTNSSQAEDFWIGDFYEGDTCIITAIPNDGSTFANWTKNGEVVSTDSTYAFLVTDTGNYVANFNVNSYDISVTTNPQDSGIFICLGAGTYYHGETCTLQAYTDGSMSNNDGYERYRFVNWTKDGVVVSTNDKYSFIVTEDANYVANFCYYYEITTSVNPEWGGRTNGADFYLHGSIATLTAVPNYGYTFVNWKHNGTIVSTDAIYSFTVIDGVGGWYEATFEPGFEIVTSSNPTTGGEVSGAGTYVPDATATLIATPNPGYIFSRWNDGNKNNPRTITVTQDTSFTAYFGVCSDTNVVETVIVCGSYTWIDGITYTESNNTATYTLTNAAGCDSTVTLHLTINNPVHTSTTETTCVSYTWTAGTGTTYTESGIYLHSHEDANGCIQVDTLHLTINNPVHTATTETACESYTWTAGTGTTYTESGTYLHSHEDANGCMQVDTLHLTINNPVHTVTTEMVCGSYTWTTGTGITYTESGTYLHSHEDANGCTQVDTLHLTINNPVHTAIIETVCVSYTWTTGTGTTYTESGTYLHSHEDTNGCIQVDTLHLTINNPVHTATTETVCGSYTWTAGTGTTYTESGTYLHSHEDANGCLQVDTLHLTINNPVHTVTTETVCGSYTWTTGTGITYTESGTYLHSHEDVHGCTQVDTLYLTINNPVHTATIETVCGSYTWTTGTGITYTESGTYLHSHEDVNGCIQVDTLHLTINNPVHTATTETACGSYTWATGTGITYTESGTYLHSHEDARGCTQVDTLHLTINNPVHTVTTETVCGSYTWTTGTGITYTESGTYFHSHEDVNGCLQVDTLHLTINTPTAGDTTAIVCGNFNWYEYFDLTQSGDYTHTLTNAAGCDSTVILHLTVNQPVTTTSTATICDSELPYVWNGLTFNEAGTQSLTLQAANGCDSIIDMTITVNPSVTIEAYLTISDNDLPYTYGDTTFMPGTVQSGDYTFNFTSADGCDSIIILHLTVETGINNHDINASMKVYPNPTAGVLNVELTINNVQSGDVAVQIYDMYGKLLDMVNVGNTDAMNRIPTGRSMDSYGEANTYGLSAQTTQIDLSSYANGVYFIKAVAEGNVVAIRKIVKNR